ncbi:hypothetical protein DL93DRAFT_767883 [Clavulina sp. PMI_390]|nr:hypothetical protein DL93DRAFT_767883 [Clavulina sp. PMI_390]
MKAKALNNAFSSLFNFPRRKYNSDSKAPESSGTTPIQPSPTLETNQSTSKLCGVNLAALPEDIIICILSHLDEPNDILSAGWSCRSLRGCARVSSIWKDVSLRADVPFPPISPPNLVTPSHHSFLQSGLSEPSQPSASNITNQREILWSQAKDDTPLDYFSLYIDTLKTRRTLWEAQAVVDRAASIATGIRLAELKAYTFTPFGDVAVLWIMDYVQLIDLRTQNSYIISLPHHASKGARGGGNHGIFADMFTWKDDIGALVIVKLCDDVVHAFFQPLAKKNKSASPGILLGTFVTETGNHLDILALCCHFLVLGSRLDEREQLVRVYDLAKGHTYDFSTMKDILWARVWTGRIDILIIAHQRGWNLELTFHALQSSTAETITPSIFPISRFSISPAGIPLCRSRPSWGNSENEQFFSIWTFDGERASGIPVGLSRLHLLVSEDRESDALYPGRPQVVELRETWSGISSIFSNRVYPFACGSLGHSFITSSFRRMAV